VLSQDQTLHKKTRKKNPSTQKEKTRQKIKPNQSENQKKIKKTGITKTNKHAIELKKNTHTKTLTNTKPAHAKGGFASIEATSPS
ncbi:hypothetical protein, partial [Brevibacterium paucivorans]|uniref:hypothetical protein n=1 Tax=Brevibacterium paucivorans TaxID=170994 RepID=UPI0032192304